MCCSNGEVVEVEKCLTDFKSVCGFNEGLVIDYALHLLSHVTSFCGTYSVLILSISSFIYPICHFVFHKFVSVSSNFIHQVYFITFISSI